MNQQQPAPPPAEISPFPGPRDLYVLAAGIILGVLLSSAALGWVAPDLYDRMFVGSGPQLEQLHQLEDREDELRERLEATGVTEAAIPEQLVDVQRQQEQLRQQIHVNRAQAQSRHAGRLIAIILAIIAVMIIEPLVAPQPNEKGRAAVSPASSRLITARYALIALWLTLAIAQPAPLANTPLLFALLLVGVALLAAFVPLGPSGKLAEQPQ